MDDAFTLSSGPGKSAYSTATGVSKWIKDNPEDARAFEEQLITSMKTKCLKFGQSSLKVRREKMWSEFHTLRTSDAYGGKWRAFLLKSGVTETSSMFCQYVGDHVFKELIKATYPLVEPAASSATPSQSMPLTYEEVNTLRYAAGWVPRALKKKLSKSTHPLSKDLKLCLLDLLDEGDEETILVNRGGLTLVNDLTFEVFLAMEQEVRCHLTRDKIPRLEYSIYGGILEACSRQHFTW